MKPALLSVAIWGATLLSALPQVVEFSNPSPVVIPDSGPANPYPSLISIPSVPWRVGKVTLTLSNLQHSSQADVNVLLVGPQGQAAYVIAGPNGAYDFTNVTITLDDDAASGIPANCTNGVYRPTGYYPEIHDMYLPFPSPAPLGPYSAELSVFYGADPNGPWRLFILDDESGDSGKLNGGWSLHFEKAYALVCRGVGGQVELSWPAEAEGYFLISSDQLDGTSWTIVPNLPTVVGGKKVVKYSPPNSMRFFKLAKY